MLAGERSNPVEGPPTGDVEALRELAEACGAELEYTDLLGRRRTPDPEALVAVLRALGAPVERAADAPEALRTRRWEEWRRPLPPVSVVWRDGPREVEVRLPADAAGSLPCGLELEGGGGRAVTCEPDRMPAVAAAEVEGREYQARRLSLGGPLPAGYHRVWLEVEGRRTEGLVVCAPRRAFHPPGEERRWGLFLPLYAVRSSGDWGIGGLTDLGALAAWIGEAGGHLAGTLPLLAAYLDEPFDPSPYAPVSRLFWNEAYVDPAAAPGWDPEVLEALPPGREAMEAELRALREAPQVEYRRVAALKREVLARLARRFFLAGGDRTPAFRSFLDETPRVLDYARFRAATELRGEAWPAWPERLREGELRPGDYGSDAVGYHLFVQWLAERQLAEAAGRIAGAGAGLYLDLPLGTHPAGYDVWRFRESFAEGVSVGAPPDDFFARGQDWGFPPVHPERTRELGHAYTVACLRQSLRHAAALRVDHVMAFHRLFWIPRGADARDGVYVRYPAEELWAVLCLESHRAGAVAVGEDLGTVPLEVREAMEARDVDGMYVVQFQVREDPERALPPVPRRTLAGLNTHDMYPFAAFWSGMDIRDRERLGLLGSEEAAEERRRRRRLRGALAAFLEGIALFEAPPTAAKVLRACVAYLGASPARTVVANLEDLWLEPRPQNVPGTSSAENWCRKARWPLEELGEVPAVREAVGLLVHLRGPGALRGGPRERRGPGRPAEDGAP